MVQWCYTSLYKKILLSATDQSIQNMTKIPRKGAYLVMMLFALENYYWTDL